MMHASNSVPNAMTKTPLSCSGCIQRRGECASKAIKVDLTKETKLFSPLFA